MFNPKNLMNEYHKLQQYEQEVQRANANSPYPPLPPTSSKRDSPSFNPIQLLAYLSQLDITNPPPGLKNALSNPIVLVGIVIFLWLLIGLLTKLVFIAVIGGGLYFLLKGTGGNGGAGPTEDVVGHRPSFQDQPSSSNQSRKPLSLFRLSRFDSRLMRSRGISSLSLSRSRRQLEPTATLARPTTERPRFLPLAERYAILPLR